MSAQDNGGPAFPPAHDPEKHCYGMTLRDYFAAKAMQGICADSTVTMKINELGRWAYRMADAMLEARK